MRCFTFELFGSTPCPLDHQIRGCVIEYTERCVPRRQLCELAGWQCSERMSDYDDDFESEHSPSKSAASARSERYVPPPRVRASSTAKSTRPARHGAEPRRSASSMGARIVGESSSLVEVTPSEQQQTLAELRRNNMRLRAELLALNRKLDDELNQRGQRGVSRVHAVPKKGAMLPSDKLLQKNEHQRKVNNELSEQLHRPHMLRRYKESTNTVGAYSADVAALSSEIRGLENVHHHQRQQLDKLENVEREMNDERAKHHQQLRDFKDQSRHWKEVRESEMSAYSKLIRQVERMEEKLRVQDEVGAAIKSVGDVREQVEEQDRVIDALKYQVAVLSKTSSGDKKRAKAVNDRIARDLHALREEADSLRKQVRALGLAGELGVDTRI